MRARLGRFPGIPFSFFRSIDESVVVICSRSGTREGSVALPLPLSALCSGARRRLNLVRVGLISQCNARTQFTSLGRVPPAPAPLTVACLLAQHAERLLFQPGQRQQRRGRPSHPPHHLISLLSLLVVNARRLRWRRVHIGPFTARRRGRDSIQSLRHETETETVGEG